MLLGGYQVIWKHTKIYTQILKAALFIIDQTWKEPR